MNKFKNGTIPLIFIIGFLILILGPGAVAKTKTQMDKEFTVKPGGNLVVESDLGSFEVLSGASDQVKIMIELEARTNNEDRAQEEFDRFDVSYEQDGNDIYVYAEYDRDSDSWFGSNRHHLNAKFTIEVPRVFNANVSTSGGSIDVGSLEGRVQVRTSGGSLNFANITGDVDGRTSGGSIEIDGCKGVVDVRTSGGSINIGSAEGDVLAKTSGGSIQVEEVQGSIEATTSGGNVTARITRQPKDNCVLKTSGGSVTVYLAENIGLSVDAETSGGRVVTDFPVTVRGELSKTSLEAEINDGGPELYLRTSGGNINLRQL